MNGQSNGHTSLEHINELFGNAGHDDLFPEGPIRTDANPLEPDDQEAERQARFQVEQEDAENRRRSAKKPTTSPCDRLLTEYLDRLRAGDTDELYRLGDALDGIEVGRGLIATLAAPPGAGKTALASQILFEGLEHNPDLTAVIANAEMSFGVVARRELSKRSGVRQRDIRFGNLSQYDWEKLDRATDELQPLLTRCKWLESPHTFDQLETLEDETPGLVVVDYLQKFAPENVETRLGVNAVMGLLRRLALRGWGVLALSATSRTRGKGGSTHDSMQLNLASLKESGECEFNADSVYLLRDLSEIEGKKWLRHVCLDCVKNRHDEATATELEFRQPKMEFVRFEQPVEEHDLGWTNDGENTGEPFDPDERF